MGFSAVAAGLTLATQRCPWFRTSSDERAVDGGPPSGSAAYLLPLLVLVGVGMLTGAMTAGFDTLYPARVVAAGAVLWAYRRSYPGLTGSWSAAGIGFAVAVVWLALVPVTPRVGPPTEMTDWPATGKAAWLAARLVGACVVAPVAEELAFRGYLMRRLIGPRFEDVPPCRFGWFSLLASSALFGGLHGHWLGGTAAGTCYGLAVLRRGRLGDAVVAHITTNAVLAAVVFLTGDWGYLS
jgi:CAAX prenyl protease-like protein